MSLECGNPFGTKEEQKSFLNNIWQQRAHCYRGLLKDNDFPYEGADLAALSSYEELSSRMITQKSETEYVLKSGPFKETDFVKIPEKNWTLLVNDVDKELSDIKEIQKKMRFVPAWRFDDVMCSYSVDGGTVGPHYDHYDVLLWQAKGKRSWKIENKARRELSDSISEDLFLLGDFNEDQEYLMEEGDVLYLPAGYAHYGISQGEGITVSFGFRAPSLFDIKLQYLEEMTSRSANEFQRYLDNQKELSLGHQITQEQLGYLRQDLPLLEDSYVLSMAFGKELTVPKRELCEPIDWEFFSNRSGEDILKLLLTDNELKECLEKDLWPWAYTLAISEEQSTLLFFLAGECIEVPYAEDLWKKLIQFDGSCYE